MARLNLLDLNFGARTHEGAPARNISPERHLRRSVLACLLWESQFYENGVEIAGRIAELIPKVAAEKVAAPEISVLCEEYGLWFHVDGAYGGFAAAVPQAHDDLRGLQLADSVALDPAQLALCSAGGRMRAGARSGNAASDVRHHPPYYHFEERVMNYVDFGPQTSRGFRALKVWLALKHVGAVDYRNMIAEDIRLSQAMAQAISRHAELQLMTQQLSITTSRYMPSNIREKLRESEVELYLDALNRELIDRLQRGGETFISNAVVDGHYVLRACIVNFHTTQTDVEAVPDIVARIGREVDAELRAN